jgi:hypothetical protein
MPNQLRITPLHTERGCGEKAAMPFSLFTFWKDDILKHAGRISP